MRLGGFFAAGRAEELPALCERLDRHGLSAIPAPQRLASMPDEECRRFGETADRLGLVIGEAGMWENLATPDPDRRAERIELVRTMLRKSEIMGCRCVVTLVGSGDPSDSPLAPDPRMLTDEGVRIFRDIVLRILDGLELTRTVYAIEPWRTSFFFRPEDVAAFLDELGDPRVRLHLDLVNMVDRLDYFATAALADRVFTHLGDRIAAAHLKDLRWDHTYLGVKWDEVPIGEGVVDLEACLRGLARLDPDLPCFCEHLATETEYAESFARLHRLAWNLGLRFLPRGAKTGTGGA
jgi:sugar phosphate isomerase/epimerase